jgi:hypothetical protein
MATNKYSWNQTLKFSWGHIIAFLALIFVSYVMYMGDFYNNGGNFTHAAINVGIIDVLLLITFIGAQIVKGTDEKFNRSIKIERILIIICPIIFVFAMIPYNHFWSVFEQREQIENQFNTSISDANKMFESYDKYAEERIKKYENNLDLIFNNKECGNNTFYEQAGFNGNNDLIKRENYIQTLKLQLLSQNTDNLKNVATKWMNEANQGTSVWNAFLVGNVDNISKAIKSWNNELKKYSEYKINNENLRGNEVIRFDEDGKLIDAVTNRIDSLKNIYTKTTGVKFNTIWTSIIIFLMLLFPYFLQKRNTRAEGLYYLIPGKKPKSYTKESSFYKNNSQYIEDENNGNKILKNDSLKELDNDDNIYGGTF